MQVHKSNPKKEKRFAENYFYNRRNIADYDLWWDFKRYYG